MLLTARQNGHYKPHQEMGYAWMACAFPPVNVLEYTRLEPYRQERPKGALWAPTPRLLLPTTPVFL